MLNTPDGMKYVQGQEERMIRHYVPTLVKALRSIHLADTSDTLYEGPTIEGVGPFHELAPNDQIVALHIAVENLLNRYETFDTAAWINGALECVYSWIYYQITQELVSGDLTGRTFISKMLQSYNSSERVSATNQSPAYWIDLVNKAAVHTIYTADQLKAGIAHFSSAPLKVTEEMTMMANRYFDDGMPMTRPAAHLLDG